MADVARQIADLAVLEFVFGDDQVDGVIIHRVADDRHPGRVPGVAKPVVEERGLKPLADHGVGIRDDQIYVSELVVFHGM